MSSVSASRIRTGCSSKARASQDRSRPLLCRRRREDAPFAADHPVSLVRCPARRPTGTASFRTASDGFPEAIREVPITESSGDTENYMYIQMPRASSPPCNGNLEFHSGVQHRSTWRNPTVWSSISTPTRAVDFETGQGGSRQASRDWLAEIAEDSAHGDRRKGVHVIVPLAPMPNGRRAKGFGQSARAIYCRARSGIIFVATHVGRRSAKGRISRLAEKRSRAPRLSDPIPTRARSGDRWPLRSAGTNSKARGRQRVSHSGLCRADRNPEPTRAEIGKISQSLTKKILNSVE